MSPGCRASTSRCSKRPRWTAPSAFQRFWHITLPLLGPMIRLSIFFSVVGALQLFDIIVPLTGGGPFDTTQHDGVVPLLFRHHADAGRLRLGGRRRAVRASASPSPSATDGCSCAMTETAVSPSRPRRRGRTTLAAAASRLGERRDLRRAHRAGGRRARADPRHGAERLQGARRSAGAIRSACRSVWVWSNYWDILTSARYWQVLGNSLLIALLTVA